MTGLRAGTRTTVASERLFAAAQRVLPGGVNSPVRAFRGVGGTPRFIARGEGAYLVDVDGNRYLDLVLSWGPLILGHAHPEVLAAVIEAAERGTTYGAPTELEVRLAERVVATFPSIEMVRFVSSGTEAVMSAVRLARGATGRTAIVKFDGCYHGHADPLLAAAGSGVATLGLPDSPGVTRGTVADTLIAPFNDLAAVEAVFAAKGGDIAAVLVEPVAGNMGVVPPAVGFLARPACPDAPVGRPAGFRRGDDGVAGASPGRPDPLWHRARPHLPGQGGRRRPARRGLRRPARPHGADRARGSGLSGRDSLGQSARHGGRSGDARRAHARRGVGPSRAVGPPGGGRHLPPSLGGRRRGHRAARRDDVYPVLHPEPVRNYAEARRTDRAGYNAFFHEMLEGGIYLPPSAFEAAFTSAVHAEAELELLQSALAAAWQR